MSCQAEGSDPGCRGDLALDIVPVPALSVVAMLIIIAPRLWRVWFGAVVHSTAECQSCLGIMLRR